MSEPDYDPASPTILDNEQMVAIFFDAEWDELAAEGFCDAKGGAEYTRISKLWIREGAPVPGLRQYITIEANLLRRRAQQ